MQIKDSGERREFSTGAVRDMSQKGRCDLLPLDEVRELLSDDFVKVLSKFQNTGNYIDLYCAFCEAVDTFYKGDYWTAILELSMHFQQGAEKYSENNWKKGIPVSSYIDSALRHYFKSMRGDKDEPHDRAVLWNIICAMWTVKNKPELNTYLKVDNND